MSSVNQDMSLFIPRVFPNITADDIKNCIQNFGLGQVERIDLVSKGEYNAAYVHFISWNNNSFTSGFQYRAADPQQRCIITYDGPWYWIVLENTSAKRVGPERRKEVINIRPEFMEPESLPFIIDETTISHADTDFAVAVAAERTVPFTIFEEMVWEMQLMQGQINKLEEKMDAQEKKYLTREIQLKKIDDDILLLKELIFNSNVDVITDAVTGVKYLRSMLVPAVYENVLVDNKEKNGLVRQRAEGETETETETETKRVSKMKKTECECSFSEIAGLYKPM